MEIFKDKSSEPMKVVNAYIEPIVKEALEKKRNSPPKEKGEISEDVDEGTLLDHLVKVTSGEAIFLRLKMQLNNLKCRPKCFKGRNVRHKVS